MLLLAIGMLGGMGTSAVGQSLFELEEQAAKAAVNHVAPSIVRIETIGGLETVGGNLIGTGPTTGLVVGEDGYVISSAFNFVQQPTSILVTLSGQKRAAAKIVARDRSRMLVLLKVNTDKPLAVPEFVPRKDMVVGQWTVAVGRVFESGRPNMSVGVLSARNRVWGKAIQTDAKISPSNYGGPLIDIRGRVLGLLVPLSPRGKGEMAGAEWYDSGIGFAIPLHEVLKHLDKLKAGEDLQPGLLGVSLKGTDIYEDPAIVAACPAKSPAAEAGIKVGDEIVQVDGQTIVRQAQLRHALGAHYAGEKVKIQVKRKGQTKDFEVTLVEKLIPYIHPFLGILPRRDSERAVIRYVYPESPAAKAGLKAGDTIISLDGENMESADALRDAVATLEPKQTVKLKFSNSDGEKTAELKVDGLPTSPPEKLPPAYDLQPAKDANAKPTGLIEIKIPEEVNECFAYVPDNYDPRVPPGLLVCLHEPGGFDQEDLLDQWKQACQQMGLILLAPKAADPARWTPGEVDFIRKAMDEITSQYPIDRSRVAVFGSKAGGAMAYLTAFQHRDLVRAVVPSDASLPRGAGPPSTDPVERLAIYQLIPKGSRQAGRMTAAAKALSDRKFPVHSEQLSRESGELTTDERQRLLRWIDSLDRI